MNDPPASLLAGQIGKPHGTGGEVYVLPISDDPHRFDAGARLLDEHGRELVIASSRRHRNRLLVHFEGVGTRRAAEDLRGPLYVEAEKIRVLEPDEFWEHEVIGCDVRLRDGSAVGRVTRLVPGAAHDLLAVDTTNGERLVPVVKEIVVEIDPTARRVVLDPPAGLLD